MKNLTLDGEGAEVKGLSRGLFFDEANGDGCAYLFANNTDLNKQDQSVTVSFSIPEAQQLLAHIGTETVKLTAEGGAYTITLSCGQFCFLEVIR